MLPAVFMLVCIVRWDDKRTHRIHNRTERYSYLGAASSTLALCRPGGCPAPTLKQTADAAPHLEWDE